ncbi:hypothetical protein HAZT_HAZT010893 [Hyalella azteca]|uniref:Uncharacterized protein n=1 Tax=Hyalella azteca TaxID=294128 RepID=A0A6A0H1S9_HYAAZ|nr:hypothetical protein HAZT_HAZT010893 [Hyalella azteca]
MHIVDVNWGSSTQSASYVSALRATLTLQTVVDHVKNYRPQILVMSGRPSSRPPLLDFANLITKNLSMMVCVEVSKILFAVTPDVLQNRGQWLRASVISLHCQIIGKWANNSCCSAVVDL